MIDDRELDDLVVRFRRHRLLARAFGWAVVLLSLVLTVAFWWSNGPAMPKDIPVRPAAEVRDGEWLMLEGFALDCADEQRLERWGPFAPGRQGATPILVSYDQSRCEDVPPRLRVQAVGITPWQRQQLERVGLAASTQDVHLLLRADVGPEQLRSWYVPLGFGLFGVVILLATWRKDSWMRPF